MSAENTALDDIALIIRNARKVANFTQAELAVYAGCSLITVQNIERGIGNPTITVLGQILVALKCPQVWIAGQSVTFPTVIRERGRKGTVVKREARKSVSAISEMDTLAHQRKMYVSSRYRHLIALNPESTTEQAMKEAGEEWDDMQAAAVQNFAKNLSVLPPRQVISL